MVNILYNVTFREPLNTVPMTETGDVNPPQLVYEEIREVPASQLTTTGNIAAPTKSPPTAVVRHHQYEEVEAAGLQVLC